MFRSCRTCKCREKGGVVVTPPMKNVQGRKTITCSLSSSPLAAFLERDTKFKGTRYLAVRNSTRSWILDPKEIPPGAYLDGPKVKDESLLDGLIYQKFPKRIGDS